METVDTDQWLAQYKTRIDGIKQAAADLEENIAEASVTISSPDGSVTVTIAPNGSLRDLRFSHRAGEHSHAELAALVMKTVSKGQRAVAEKVVEAFEPLGAGTSAMDLLTRYTPEEAPDEQGGGAANAYDQLTADTPPAPQAPVPPAPLRAPAPPRATAPPPMPQMPAQAPRPRPTRQSADEGDEFGGRPW